MTQNRLMQRWNKTALLHIGEKLFTKTLKRKRLAHPNHDIHFMTRKKDWLEQGVVDLINGSYTPRPLKRLIFDDEVVDQLHISDRIFQHMLLKQIKPTFSHIMNAHCYHLHGPTGVKYATQVIRKAFDDDQPQYMIRADIKSFYASIPHCKLIQDIKNHYDDPKLIMMLTEVIKNPLEKPTGYSNPIKGIALRGPLSQFFSALYLKPLDDALSRMDVTYCRYQDDILVLCKTKRQLNRCKRRMMTILQERRLTLSRKKSRMGTIKHGFHFLGIHYLPTQPEDHTIQQHDSFNLKVQPRRAQLLSDRGGKQLSSTKPQAALQLIPHARTLRKAREQIKCMVADGLSTQEIRIYLSRWLQWWTKTNDTWTRSDLTQQFFEACWDDQIRAIASSYLLKATKVPAGSAAWVPA